jgi:hypothetical protein
MKSVSAYIFGRVLYHPALTTPQKITLAAIADVVNDHGFGWMLISTLQLKTSLSRSGVQKALRELTEMTDPWVLKRRVRNDRCSQFLINVNGLPDKPKPNEAEMELPAGWGSPDEPRGGSPHGRGGPHGERGGPPGEHITLTEPGNETLTPLPFGKDTPTGENDLFGKGQEIVETEPSIDEWVLSEWNKLATDIPTIAKIRVLDDARRRKINARLKAVRVAEPDARAAWAKIFAAIRANTFLRGEEPPTRDYPEPFRLDLDFVLRPSQFIKILEGGYRATRTAETHDLVSGRRFGPAEQAGRNAVRRILAAGSESGDGSAGNGDPSVDGAGSGQGGRLRSAFDQYRDDDVG